MQRAIKKVRFQVEEKPHENQFERILEKANHGNVDCMILVGECYLEGLWGVAQDGKKALHWFKKAADIGKDPHAQYRTAYCYGTGTGVEVNSEEAFTYCKLAAEKDPVAQLLLGKCLAYGIGTQKDFHQAFFHIEAVAKKELEKKELEKKESCSDEALILTGWFHENGLGTKINLKKALACYENAWMKTHSKLAALQLGYCYQQGVGTRKARYVNEFKTFYQNATSFKFSSESSNYLSDDPHENFARSVCFEYGFLHEIKNPEVAAQLLIEAADKNHPRACFELAKAYQNGLLQLPKDFHKAFLYFQKAANAHYAAALPFVKYYKAFLSEAKDIEATDPKLNFVELYRSQPATPKESLIIYLGKCFPELKAFCDKALAGDSLYMFLLAENLKDGKNGFPKNAKQAFYWFQRLSIKGFAPAHAMLALCYQEGIGVEVNFKAASKYKIWEAEAKFEYPTVTEGQFNAVDRMRQFLASSQVSVAVYARFWEPELRYCPPAKDKLPQKSILKK